MTATDIRQLRQRLAERTGLDHDLLGRPALEGFVQRRCQELGVPDERAYHELVIRDADEMERLVQEVSVAETWFFRYPASFELLTQHVAGVLGRTPNKLSMLSIACATGEEPYSMVMAATQAGWPLDRIVVDAVDRHEASLAAARDACYRPISFREDIPAWAQPWFRETENGVHVDAGIKSAVRFVRDDILGARVAGVRPPYDVVFCRNLFIYLGDAARKKLADFLSSVIAPDGLLFVGHAEFAILSSETFESAEAKHAFALRLKRSESAAQDAAPVARKPTPGSAVPRNRSLDIATQPPRPRPAQRTETDATPHDPVTLEDARAMANAGRLTEALAAIQSISSTQPESRTEFLDLLGSIQLGLGQLDEARDTFHKVLYFEPHHEEALLQMAIVCDRLDDAEQAARYRRRAARAHNENPQQ